MTRPLAGLLRLQERRLKDVQSRMAEKLGQLAEIDARAGQLEHATLQPSADLSLSTWAWQSRLLGERRRLAQLRREILATVEELRGELRDVNAEKLAYETVAQRLLSERMKMRAMREQAEVDDLVAARFRQSQIRQRAAQ